MVVVVMVSKVLLRPTLKNLQKSSLLLSPLFSLPSPTILPISVHITPSLIMLLLPGNIKPSMSWLKWVISLKIRLMRPRKSIFLTKFSPKLVAIQILKPLILSLRLRSNLKQNTASKPCVPVALPSRPLSIFVLKNTPKLLLLTALN